MKTLNLTARELRSYLLGQSFTCIVNGISYTNEATRELLKGIERDLTVTETGILQLTFNL
jgi:hypothetical protein